MLMLPFFVNNSITQSSKMRRLSSLINRNFIRAFASEAGQSSKPPPAAAAPPKPPKIEPPPPPPKVDPLKNVTGLSKKCVATNDQKQVPGTGKEYLVMEYYGYNQMSFAEAEVELEKFRLAQPVAPCK